MSQATLEGLPADVLIDVTSRLGTAPDVARLGTSSRRLARFLHEDGWRTFIKGSFPSLRVPSSSSGGGSGGRGDAWWTELADRVTYLDQCWEKRAFSLHEYSEKPDKGPGRGGRGGRGGGGRQPPHHRQQAAKQSVSFHPVLAARLSSSLETELVAWGVGEELILRVRPTFGGAGARGCEWHRMDGAMSGQVSGFGDVTALSLIERRQDMPEIVIGRANGDLQLVKASDDYFSNVARPSPPGKHGQAPPEQSFRKSPGQTAITWTEWEPTTNIVASCNQSILTLYDINDTATNRLAALDSYDLSSDSVAGDASLLRSVKFLSSDTIACALGNAHEPVRWAKLTPTGPQFFMPAKNQGSLDYLSSMTEVTTESRTTVRAIEVVDRPHHDSLLLAAWDDGTYRLTDIRTPSPHDAVYRDRWDVYDAGSSLLVYGSRHFVAGSNVSASLRFFDFRYPKPYHYTSALPCSSEEPYPPPPATRTTREQQYLATPPAEYHETCDVAGDRWCAWHAQSREDRFRPDTTLHLGRGRFERVHALAKASDVSDAFFCGLQGSVVEVDLKLAEDAATAATTTGGVRDAPAGWRVEAPKTRIAAVETGVSLCREGEWLQQDTGYPELYYHSRNAPPRAPDRRRRYDASFRHHSEFPGTTSTVRRNARGRAS